MNARTVLLLTALVAAASAPPASAQFSDLTVTASAPAAPFPYEGPSMLTFNVTLGCGLLLENAGSVTVTVTAPDAPAYLAVAPASLEFAPDAACLTGAGSITQAGSLTLTPSPDAPGLSDIPLGLVASAGSTTSAPAPVVVQVAYRPGHRITPDVTFPLEVDGPVTFNLTLEFSGNARSMIMFEEVAVERGSLSGLAPIIMVPPATEVLELTFTPPEGDWTSSNVTFYNYSHFLLESGAAGGPELAARPVWTFVQADGGQEPSDGGDKDSPAPAAAWIGLGLLGLAFVLRRRA